MKDTTTLSPNIMAHNITDQLCTAAREGTLPEVVRLVQNIGAEVNARGADGTTPLHRACERGCLDVAQYLVSNGAAVDASENDGSTPVHRACFGGHLEVVQYLFHHGASVDARNDYGWTPLHYACYGGYLEIVQYLVHNGAAVDADQNGEGWTPLHFACDGGYLDVVQYLVGKGAAMNATDDKGWTPLHRASKKQRSELVHYLSTIVDQLRPLTEELTLGRDLGGTTIRATMGTAYAPAANILDDWWKLRLKAIRVMELNIRSVYDGEDS